MGRIPQNTFWFLLTPESGEKDFPNDLATIHNMSNDYWASKNDPSTNDPRWFPII